MGYIEYGIDPGLVEAVKARLQIPPIKEQVKALTKGLTKHDLQDRAAVTRLFQSVAAIVGVPVPQEQASRIIQFVLDQKIDPNNTFHLIRLWSMFR